MTPPVWHMVMSIFLLYRHYRKRFPIRSPLVWCVSDYFKFEKQYTYYAQSLRLKVSTTCLKWHCLVYVCFISKSFNKRENFSNKRPYEFETRVYRTNEFLHSRRSVANKCRKNNNNYYNNNNNYMLNSDLVCSREYRDKSFRAVTHRIPGGRR